MSACGAPPIRYVAVGALQSGRTVGLLVGGENVDWEGDLAYDGRGARGRARISHIRRFDSFAVALTGEAATDGSVAFGLNLNFSLDPGHGFSLSRRPLARPARSARTVYRDLNDNGLHDPSEPLEKGALITTGTVRPKADRCEGGGDRRRTGRLLPVAVGVDPTSLDDPMLVPKTALQVVVPRPGVPADVQIGLVGGGDIEGAIVKSGGLGFEGLDLELIDDAGKVVATARTDFDGFFLFDRVPYGHYSIRVSDGFGRGPPRSPPISASTSSEPTRGSSRTGAVVVRPLAQIASAAATP